MSAKRKRKRRKKYSRIRVAVNIIITIAVIFVVYKAAMFAYNYAFSSVSSEYKEPDYSNVSSVVIKEGSSTSDIAKALKDAELIDSEIMFRVKSRFGGYDETYKFGTYEIPDGLSDEDIMLMLQRGQSEQNSITIPEGYTIKQIASYLEEKGICTYDEFINKVQNGSYDYEFLREIPSGKEYKLEGYLYPDTYYIAVDADADYVINKMLERFENIYNNRIKEKIENSDKSLYEIITIASIIEKEIVVDEERALASSVIYNRLLEGMPLQIDATVIYAIDKHTDSLTSDELKYDSPYNTYVYSGLPKGPISNPGLPSILAALEPADTDYLYYVLESQDSSNHVFCESYNEFVNAKAAFKGN